VLLAFTLTDRLAVSETPVLVSVAACVRKTFPVPVFSMNVPAGMPVPEISSPLTKAPELALTFLTSFELMVRSPLPMAPVSLPSNPSL
jgi:hypothetical protein